MPKISYEYAAKESGGLWSIVEKDAPVKLCTSTGSKKATLTWTKVVSGQCTLRWTKGYHTLEKVIVVQSLY